MRPRLLDLYCGEGIGARGYKDAGWYVVGVDKHAQANYAGDEFIQADALDFLNGGWFWERRIFGDPAYGPFTAIHTSPPCQFATDYQRTGNVGDDHENLIPATRELLVASGLPYVIENVEKARPWLNDPTLLCGSMFDLDVKRHRLFETNWSLSAPWPCRHGIWSARYPAATNLRPNSRRTVEIGVWRIPLETQKWAMGVAWDVTLEGLSEGIPPAYTEHIGGQLFEHVRAVAA